MTERHATFFVCDELLVSLSGKWTVSGLYTSDIVIPADPTQLAQLVFLVQAETPISKPFQSLIINVYFPDDPAPKALDASSLIPQFVAMPGRSSIRLRVPFLVSQPLLKVGPIEVRVVHEDGELLAGKQWVLSVAQWQEIQAHAARR